MKNNKLLFTITIVFVLTSCISANWKEAREKESLESDVKVNVENWIKQNSKYPETYTPVSFADYVFGWSSDRKGKIENSDRYEIVHRFKLKTLEETIIDYEGCFILNHKLIVTDICDVVRSDKTTTYYSKYDEWFSLFAEN